MGFSTMRKSAYDIAFRLIGETEIKGAQHNTKIVQMLKIYGYSADEVAWCSAFVAYCVQESGYSIENTTASARSWLNWGKSTTNPKKGDIVVFQRPPSPTSGHVAFFDSFTSNGSIRILGGNQGESGSVTFTNYKKSALLGFRTYE